MMYYGAQYYRPPFPGKDCWQRDMENMRRLGFTCVKLWAVWNWVERTPGEFHFEGLDELVILENFIPQGMIGDQKKLNPTGGENSEA